MNYINARIIIMSIIITTFFIVNLVFVGCSVKDDNHSVEMEISMTEGYVTTDDSVKLYYQKIGNSNSIVIIPNALYLYDDFKYLASDHTIIFYDMRNRGRSDKVSDNQKLSRGILDDVEDLETIRKHFSRGKIKLVGHSYLGLMVFLYSSKYPDNVDRMVQIGPMQFNLDTKYPEHLTVHDEIPVPNPQQMEELTNLEAIEYNETNPREYSKKWWSIIRSVYVTNPRDTVKIFSAIDEFPNEWPNNQMKHLTENILPSIQNLDIKKEEIERCGFPVLTVHGTMDRAVPYGAGREWVYNFPNARLVTIENGGHMPWIESPDIVYPSIRKFLSGEWPEQAEEINMADFK